MQLVLEKKSPAEVPQLKAGQVWEQRTGNYVLITELEGGFIGVLVFRADGGISSFYRRKTAEPRNWVFVGEVDNEIVVRKG